MDQYLLPLKNNNKKIVIKSETKYHYYIVCFCRTFLYIQRTQLGIFYNKQCSNNEFISDFGYDQILEKMN